MSTIDDDWAALDDEPHPDRGGLFDQLRPQPWMEQASCATADPVAWFPEKGASNNQAIAICRQCPVAAECLDYALANQERFGIWGGVTERPRRRLTNPNPAA